MPPPEISIRPIRPSDVAASRALRLAALRDHPESFGSDYADLLAAPEGFWLQRVSPSFAGETARVCVAVGPDETLVGTAGIVRDQGAKVDHSAFIWGVYVRPEWRGHGIAEALIRELLVWAAGRKLRRVRLSATTTNAAAIRCYQRLGFEVYGVEPEVIRVGNVYHDELLMWRRVGDKH